jgi:peptidoglycan/LPS O-acetylase OafA/YrhL
LPALTSLRFFAALLVVLYHGGQEALAFMPALVRGILKSGVQAVGFFFVLSGFVLAYSYFVPGQNTIRNENSQFWKNRFARIYPAYFAGLLLALPIFAFNVHKGVHSLPQAVAAVTLSPFLLQSWASFDVAQAINLPAWSLSVEMFFYAIFPFAFRIAVTRGWRFAAVAAYGIVLVTYFWPIYQPYWPMNHLGAFVAGIAAGLWYRTDRHRPAWPVLIFSAIAILGLLGSRQSLPLGAISPPILVPLYALMITAVATCTGRLGLLESTFLVLLGDASYSLYILHFPVLGYYRFLMKALHISPDSLPIVCVFVVLVVAISVACYKLIELPGRKQILKLLA